MKKTLLFLIATIVACSVDLFAQTWYDFNSAMSKKEYSYALSIINQIGGNDANRDSNFYFQRAKVYEGLNNYVFAICDMTSAIELSPNNKHYFAYRGELKQKFGDASALSDLVAGGKVIVSDVDVDIPSSGYSNPNTFALIIANENYYDKGISKVPYAHHDAEIFSQYCEKTLGIPSENIHLKKDLTLNQIRSELRWIDGICSVYGKEARIIIYYSGHGMSDEKNHSGFMLPIDAIPNDPESGVSLQGLYTRLGRLSAENVLVFIDACFSGSARGGGLLLTSGRGVIVAHDEEDVTGNLCVFAASHGDETAYTYDKKGHGLFTYFLLKKLKDSNAKVTIGELSKYVTDQVKKMSIVVNEKMQTPTVNASSELSNWRNLKLSN